MRAESDEIQDLFKPFKQDPPDSNYTPYDGYKEKVEIKPNKCAHVETQIISGNELRCKSCPASWMGHDIITLKNLLANRG